MKTAGYDIALLLNERFLNELSGALFYNGFLTVNGSVDLYTGTIELEHVTGEFNKDLSVQLTGKVTTELQPFLKMDFRFKLTREPLIDFVQGTTTDELFLRLSLGMRIYFWLWQGLEVKFDAGITIAVPLSINEVDKKLCLIADLKNSIVSELSLKYGAINKATMTENLDQIVEKALQLYFTNNTICKSLSLPCLSNVVKDIKQFIHPDKNEKNEDLGIIPVSVDAMRIVSPTVLAVGINLMGYKGGNPDQLHDFIRNCSVGIAVSENALQKVYEYVWTHSQFVKQFGSNGNMMLVKNYDNLTLARTGTFKVKKLDEVLDNVARVVSTIATNAGKMLSGGFLEPKVDYLGMDFDYGLVFTLKNKPMFDLQGGNRVVIYNMAFSVLLHLACTVSIQHEVDLDTSGWIPDEWTPWKDDVALFKKQFRETIFNKKLRLDNLELRWGLGTIVWNNDTMSLDLKIEKINLYWNFDKPGSPLKGLPAKLINWITDQLEDDIVKKIPTISITPPLSFNLPLIPWQLQVDKCALEITNSEIMVAAKLGFNEIRKDIFPVFKYVVNTNNKEIHKIGCDSVTDTYEVHQRGYHLLNDALNDDNDGCRNCLPAFHKK